MRIPTDKECRDILGLWYWAFGAIGIMLGLAIAFIILTSPLWKGLLPS